MDAKAVDSYIRRAYADRLIGQEINSKMLGTRLFIAQMNHVPGESFKILYHGRDLAVPEHGHDYFEMMYVYDGSITQLIDSEKITLDKGAICLLDTKINHSIEATTDSDIALNFLMHKEMFSHCFLAHLLENTLFSEFFTNALYRPDAFGRYIAIHTGNDERVRGLVTSIVGEYIEPDICSAAVIESLIQLLFNQLFRVWRSGGGRKILRTADGVSNIRAILRYMEVNYKTATLKTTAARFGYSPSYLSTLLAKTTGHSFTAIKHEICMNQAAFLLTNSDMIISDVAQSVGFSNMSFFYSVFNRKFSMTPAEYREQKREEKT